MGEPRSQRAEGLSGIHWAALLLAPAGWSAFFLAAWVLPPAVCQQGGQVWLHAAVAATLAVTCLGLALALRTLRRDRSGSAAWLGAESARSFSGSVATLISALLAIGPLIAWAFVIVIGPCE